MLKNVREDIQCEDKTENSRKINTAASQAQEQTNKDCSQELSSLTSNILAAPKNTQIF